MNLKNIKDSEGKTEYYEKNQPITWEAARQHLTTHFFDFAVFEKEPVQPEKYPGFAYQPLFDLMSQEHNLTLLQSEMDDIIHVVAKLIQPSPSEVKGTTPQAERKSYVETFKELKELTSGYWDQFNTNEEINKELGRTPQADESELSESYKWEDVRKYAWYAVQWAFKQNKARIAKAEIDEYLNTEKW